MADGDAETAQVGTCALCGQVMIKTEAPGSAPDAWHPANVPVKCPPEPSGPHANDPYALDGWVAFHRAGKQPGRPGVQHFIPGDKPPFEVTRTKKS